MSRSTNLTSFLHLATLSAFALTQPLLNILSGSPEFFVAHRAGPLVLFGLALIATIALPAGLWFLETLVGIISTRVRTALHIASIAGLAAIAALVTLNRVIGWPPSLQVAAATGAGVLFAVLYLRVEALRRFLSIASMAAVLFPLNFLLVSPVSALVLPTRAVSTQAAEIKATTPVVLVLLDEFNLAALMKSETEIDEIRYPNFAALAATSTWFTKAMSTYPETRIAIPSILTGLDAAKMDGPPTYAAHPENIFSWLGARYSLNVHETVTSLCPETLCARQEAATFNPRLMASDLGIAYLHTVLPLQWREAYLPPLTTGWNGFGSEAAAEAAKPQPKAGRDFIKRFGEGLKKGGRDSTFSGFLEGVQRGDRNFDFLHILLPHAWYEYLPDGSTYDRDAIEGVVNGVSNDNEYLLALAYQRLMLQTGFTDHLIGDLMTRLKKLDRFDRSLIIITADHGRTFSANVGSRDVAPGNAADLVNVPMFVKLPGQTKPTIETRPVSNRDIVATIADVIGAPYPWATDSVSMLAKARPPLETITYREDGRRNESVAVGDMTVVPRLQWKERMFGTGMPLDALTIRGNFQGLLGQTPPANQPPTNLRWRADRAARFANVDMNSGYLPAKLDGSVTGVDPQGAEGPFTVAIALNDRIVAVAPSYEWQGDRRRVSVMLPKKSFRQGANRVQAFLVTGTPNAPVLSPMENSSAPLFAIQASGNERSILAADGNAYAIRRAPALGQGIVRKKDSTRVNVWGWAMDRPNGEAASSVLVFLDGRYITQLPTGKPRPTVARRFGDAALKSGFEATISAAKGDLRFFALVGDKAMEVKMQERKPGDK